MSIKFNRFVYIAHIVFDALLLKMKVYKTVFKNSITIQYQCYTMGRPKRKLSPIKSDAKLRQLGDFGFSKPKESDKESACKIDDGVGEIVSFE